MEVGASLTHDSEDDETITAYHEAGHAVVAYALGGEVEAMSLWGEADDYLPERFGDIRIRWGAVWPESQDQLYRELMTVLAGPVSEQLYRDEELTPRDIAAWESDWQHAVRCVRLLARDVTKQQAILREVLRLLRDQLAKETWWAAVAAVADELVAHEQLEWDQVDDILRFWLRK